MTLIDRYVTVDATGGGTGTFGDPWTFAEAVSNYAPGDRVNVIEGTYNLEATTLSTSIGHEHPIVWRGRNSDDTGDGRPILNMGSNAFTITGDGLKFYNFDIYSNNLTATLDISSPDNCIIYACKVYNDLSSSATVAARACRCYQGTFLDCLFSNKNNLSPISSCLLLSKAIISGCKVVTPSQSLIDADCGFRHNTLTDNLFIGTGNGYGVYLYNCLNLTDSTYIKNNTFYNFENGIVLDQLPPTNAAAGLSIVNNLFHTCVSNNPSTDGFAIKSLHQEQLTDYPLNTPLHIIKNAYYNCSAGLHNLGDNPDIGTIECTDDPFSNISAGDFSLNNAPNGGSLLRGTFASPAYNWE